jgi:hypothetical protein
MNRLVGAVSRFVSARQLKALIGLIILVAATAFITSRIDIGFPGRVTTPEAVGLVASITTDPDVTAHVVLADGQTFAIRPSDRTLGGFGDLLFVGDHPDRWYLPGFQSQEQPGCYWIAASRAYSDADSVVFVFEEWPGVGVRLPKAPGYDDSKMIVGTWDGRLRYSSIGPISLCANEEGQITGSR